MSDSLDLVSLLLVLLLIPFALGKYILSTYYIEHIFSYSWTT